MKVNLSDSLEEDVNRRHYTGKLKPDLTDIGRVTPSLLGNMRYNRQLGAYGARYYDPRASVCKNAVLNY